MNNGIAPVDTGYLRQSAQEVGGMIKDAVSEQMEEVNSLLEMQAQASQATQTINDYEDTYNSGINILA